MKTFATSLTALLLLALMAVAGMLGSGVGLLMVLPFIALLLPLLAGLYPGEQARESLIALVRTRRGKTRGTADPCLTMTPWYGRSVSIAGAVGSRGPPSSLA